MIIEIEGKTPRIDPNAIILEPCVIAGDVEIGAETSIWFFSVIRGDVGAVRIGKKSNIQDGCIIHETRGFSQCIIGDEVTIGHGAIIHGAILKDRCLIGMGAVVLDNAVIGEGALVAAGALIPQGMSVPPRHLVVGVPGKVLRQVTDEETIKITHSMEHYVALARCYQMKQSSQAIIDETLRKKA